MGEYLTYAEPGHPEWRRYRAPEAMVAVEAPAMPAGFGMSPVAGQVEGYGGP